MASQQAYHAYTQSQGTLSPGQSISVNKFNVQVERYLSQGGFAHVYLVRTATPVYNTTHHVLKRIAVASEAMLTEVKKEVDVMRLLKGHPNIVHLIDAAWHKMPDGTYEVFILMEFCPGGGIIDMMNRRLRERLTEAEILQIFVDVCEGVACMHNLRPALLHRDLKVENILQSTSTSYKLCDFGSATNVSRPPANTQEIRALEADLNRHTTLQYRAPEMVDVYSRRPVDEKSDVWALGVLLYKLCYYTTPFEEHGQLAILNVQYRIPPYPVYSPHMNQLIASMLQEHGVRRPSVFELLSHVHRLRGTKSRFKYTIPVSQPLSQRQQTQFRPSPSPSHIESTGTPPPNRAPKSVSPSKGQGIQAREKVMEAIAPLRRGDHTFSNESGPSSASSSLQNYSDIQPMRRGRPSNKETEWSTKLSSSQKPSDPQISKPENADHWLDDDFLKGSGMSKHMATNDARGDNGSADIWNINGKEPQAGFKKDNYFGFGDDFAEKLWDSVGGAKPHSQTQPDPTASSKLLSTRPQPPLGINARSSSDKDAFEGLGLGTPSEKPAPTLAEARKLRTGLAIMNSGVFRTNPDKSGIAVSQLALSPRQTPPSQSQLYPSSVPSPSPNLSYAASSRLSPQPASRRTNPSQSEGLPAESRFPSLEELDARYSPSMPSNPTGGSPSYQGQDKSYLLARRNGVSVRPSVGDAGLLKPDSHPRGSQGREGIRSEQVTGISMRESRGGSNDRHGGRVPVDSLGSEENKATSGSHPSDENNPSLRPSLTRKHRSSVTMKHTLQPSSSEPATSSTFYPQTDHRSETRLSAPKKPKDWLTGDDLDDDSSTSLLSTSPGEKAVLRDSPSKRASVIQSSTPIQDAVVAQHDHVQYIRRTPSPSLAPSSEPQPSPTLSRFSRAFPPIDTSDDPHRGVGPAKRSSAAKLPRRSRDLDSASSGDEGPEDAAGVTHLSLKTPPQKRSHKGRQSSVHDLVDLYGGGLVPKEKERDTHLTRLTQVDSEPSSQGLKGRLTVTTINSAKSNTNLASASSRTLLSPISINSSGRQLTGSEQHSTPALGGPTPSPSRSRPQSMFIFPSKSSDSYSPASAGQSSTSPRLMPPEDSTPRANKRRTSISDMVQRYEGFGGGAKSMGLGGSLSPGAPRPVGKLGSDSTDSRYFRKNADKERATTTLPVPGDLGWPPRSPTEPNRTSPAPKISNPIPLQHDTLHKESDDIIPRNTSLKPEPSRPRFLSRQTTEDSSSHMESGSSSPERPYQGVGKLIDQWQRKTAEAEPSKTGFRGRGTHVAKRAGVAHDSFK